MPSLRDSLNFATLPGTPVPGFHIPSLRDLGMSVGRRGGWPGLSIFANRMNSASAPSFAFFCEGLE